ncbi:YraN family protein [uncultured Pseudomonas sp.]|uniref:YraN family protein n=1 Tax=uncultured Pseudomonas sp. TaxID=114707 RepID=UPI002600182F|nr:YraN family protein [uncultured Pseudomonas sp.]
MRPGSQVAGREAETFALQHLQQHGLQLLARNWTCRRGELDLVMLDDSTVVFVEVRYRRHNGWGSAMESIDARKQERLIAAAQQFLHEQPRWAESPCRFDVIAVEGTPGEGNVLNWLKSAFDS